MWMVQFLSLWETQHVVVDGETSEEVEINARVPQLGLSLRAYLLPDQSTPTTPLSDCLQMTAPYTSPSLQKMTAKNSKKAFKLWRGGRLMADKM